MTYIGIDNGVSGAIGILGKSEVILVPMPVKRVLNYTKKKAWHNRIDVDAFKTILREHLLDHENPATVFLERPMVNPGRFNATLSAMRALEATLIVLEELEIPYQYVDSKQWQKVLLPMGLKGPELKEAGIQVAKKLFPKLILGKGMDADAILIAEFARRER